MSGIYIHIPFCHRACHYCDFYFSTSQKLKAEIVNNICKEINLRKDFFSEETQINTLYFGGGTPSLLNEKELEQIILTLRSVFDLSELKEFTFEINPEDVNEKSLEVWREIGINRFSLGIQSFEDDLLRYLNRNHTGNDGILSILKLKEAGFDNVSIDLIYGIPGLDFTKWKNQLNTAIEFDIPHISAYCLTIEPNTVFGNYLKKGKMNFIDEDLAKEQYFYLHEFLEKNGFEHYEISNFGKPNFTSKHNTSYWNGKQYLGIGPSAHSFDGEKRMWNVSNNFNYIKSIESNSLPLEYETLTKNQQLNEYILTGIRTKWGIDINKIKLEISKNEFEQFKNKINHYLHSNLLKIENDCAILSVEGFWKADGIAGDLFL
jgi:oxygen-independent coproporphyrinogen III oxidase